MNSNEKTFFVGEVAKSTGLTVRTLQHYDNIGILPTSGRTEACHNPKVLILDEPTAGLDVEGRHALHKELKKLKADGVSILIATHDMAEAETLCDTIAILKDGHIVRQGNPMELTASASIQSRVILKTRKSCLKTNPLMNTRQPDYLEDEYLSFACVDVAEFLLSILTHIKSCGDSVVDLMVERASIEDIFLSVAGGEN